MKNEDIGEALHAWAPELEELFNALGCLGSDLSVNWLNDSEWHSDLQLAVRRDGCPAAVDIWVRVLREDIALPAPALLVVLEHLRKNPSQAAASLARFNFGFSKSLANVSYRAADALYEGAKECFAGDEIDLAIAGARVAISEFRFAIESEQLTDPTKRIATGKYATAIAMIGRWIDLPRATIERALQYSQESMALGNLRRETLTYRLELLILQFDQTSDAQFLREALELLSEHQTIAEGSELAEAEARFRLAQLSDYGSREARRYLVGAESRLSQFHARNGVEEARRSILSTLISEVKEGRLEISARSIAVPRGLLVLMATKPSAQLWSVVRTVINGLEVLRTGREWVPAAVFSARLLRQMIDGPAKLLISGDIPSYVDIAEWLSKRVPWNRHFQWEAGAAALSAAKRTGSQELARRAQEIFENLAAEYTTWPLPRIGIARVQDYLASVSQDSTATIVSNWRDAAELALKSPTYTRSNLGGRNQVFAVADARGFLSETFVFKRTTKGKAEYEASMMGALGKEIVRLGNENRFEVPRSLAIVEVAAEDERRWVHVSQRASGRLVSDLRPDEASSKLEAIVDLLAIFHRIAGQPDAGRSAWRSLKDHLKMWARTLLAPEQAERFVNSLRGLFPAELPLVRKRDGHASNWLVDPAGRIVAIDLESSEFVPIGFDVAQLIEDNALIEASPEGWSQRLTIFKRYSEKFGVDLSDEVLGNAYGWFALTRALRLGTEREAGKHLRRHAREVCGMLMDSGLVAIREVAQELFQALSRVEQKETSEAAPSHDHRRLSKSMAYQLRHNGPSNGLVIDEAGFTELDELAHVLKVESSQLLAVAEHPGEPRFEVRDGRIRALYGHSLDVVVDVGIRVGEPASLYHGSSWSALDAILGDGLTPMQRRMVHLTNNAGEALSVGQRKGAPVVLAIDQSSEEEPVAEGIWVVASVAPERLSVLNPFSEEAGASK
jgi:RNA:NAD 2'-phosphotransferase (TPT1/KptA family)